MKRYTILLLSSSLLFPALAKIAPADFGKFPIGFEPNCGQAGSSARYVARGNGYLLEINDRGSRMLLRRGGRSANLSSVLVGARKGPAMDATVPLGGHSSYFRGGDSTKWITGVPTFAKVKASGVYPGIDLVYYGTQERLEYDFIVAPGADPRAIRLRFDGVDSLRTDNAGNLILSTKAGEIMQNKPALYQIVNGERSPVAGNFVVGSHRTVSFHVDSYNHSEPLIIDPVLVYSSFIGGSDIDEGHAVAVDRFGNLYLTGVTFSTQHGDADVLVRKIATDGSGYVYNADIGGSGADRGNGIAVDSNGYAFVGGRTTSRDFPVANAFQGGNAGTNNAFVLRLDPSGSTLIFSTYIGGSGDDRGFALALDQQGSVYLAGAASSPDFPTSPGAFQRQLGGGLDCFIAKFDPQGNANFSTLIGGGSDDQAFGIAVDRFGDAFITGQTNSDSYPQANAVFQHSRHGGLDAFITEITPDGSGLIYSTFVGGGSDDNGTGIAVDPAGNAFITGTTSSGDFATTNGTSYNGGNSDIFVTAYSVNGNNLIFSSVIGSHGTDEGGGIALDANDNVYIVGDSNSDQYPVSRDAGQSNRSGGFDVVLSILDPTGNNLLYSTFLGGSGDDFGYAVAVDRNGDAYLTGVTSSSDFPLAGNPAQSQAGGGASDGFFAKIGFSSASGVFFTATPVNAVSAFQRGMVVASEKPGLFSAGGSQRARAAAR